MFCCRSLAEFWACLRLCLDEGQSVEAAASGISQEGVEVVARSAAVGGGTPGLRFGATQGIYFMDLHSDRYCLLIGRPHRARNPCLVVNTVSGSFYQMCADDRCLGLRSPVFPLPARFHVAGETGRGALAVGGTQDGNRRGEPTTRHSPPNIITMHAPGRFWRVPTPPAGGLDEPLFEEWRNGQSTTGHAEVRQTTM